jgi:acetyl esterase/lipase
MKTIARLMAFVTVAACGLLYMRLRAPVTPMKGVLWICRLLAEALTPFVALGGVVAAVLGLLIRSPVVMLTGMLGGVLAARDVLRVTAAQAGFAQAFGPDWERAIDSEREAKMLQRRWTWQLPDALEASWKRDIPYWTIPGSDRRLLCDLWQPPAGIAPSGLALVYVYGSAWCFFDKDFGTRHFFRHLAAQGHVIMDVAYRLHPETDMLGMVGDVKRAIAWMKAHASAYGVDPERVVLAGASAGGYLALLTAYTPKETLLTPGDLGDVDLSVRGVISCYAPAEARIFYDYTNQDAWARGKAVEIRPPDPLSRRLFGSSYVRLGLGKRGATGALEPLLGGTPETVPERYALFSPTTHVGPSSPATLLIQGKNDLLAPLEATNLLFEKLVAAGVPAVNIVFPHAEHGFDLTLPRWSPAAQTAWYYQERFLAQMV